MPISKYENRVTYLLSLDEEDKKQYKNAAWLAKMSLADWMNAILKKEISPNKKGV